MSRQDRLQLALAASLALAFAFAPDMVLAADDAAPASGSQAAGEAAPAVAPETAPPAQALPGHAPEIAAQDWTFTGPFGAYDNAQLQRGFAVYKTVCAACHSMRLLSYRNLAEPGGPGFTPDQAATLASEVQVTDGPDDTGQMFQRPGRPADRFRSPFPNDAAARAANHGALPPDLSVMAKARPGGPDYIYAILTGYRDPPPGFNLSPGMHYNIAFPGHQIAMPPPLMNGVVAYTDGTQPTLDNYARDVSAFLMWAAEPKLEERHMLGARVMVFLIVFAVLMFLAKRAVWGRLHGKAVHTA
jgi:cytochrome c1